MTLGPILGTVNRFKYADFPTHYNDETGFYCIVSYPKETFNLAAPLKPLSYQVEVAYTIKATQQLPPSSKCYQKEKLINCNNYQVWISIASGALAVTLYLNFVEFGVSRWFQSKSSSKFTSVSGIRRQITYFVWGNLVSQGNLYKNKGKNI